MKQESVELSALIEEQLKLDAGLLEQRGQHLVQELTQEITVIGDATLLGKVLGNLISNASLYSPNGAEIRVWCGWLSCCAFGEYGITYRGGRSAPSVRSVLSGGVLPEPHLWR